MNPLAVVGHVILVLCETAGELVLFALRALFAGLRGPFYPRQILRQMVEIGYYSLPVVGLTAIFTGMVLALQSQTGLARFQAASATPTIVVLSMTRELGPVLAGLMVAGRVGAAMAAELGTMRVTEQIDALESLGRSPASHLLLPKVLACLLMIPVLVVFADVVALLSGWFAAKQALPITDQDFAYGARVFWRPFDAYYSIIKAAFFALTIGLVSCYYGYMTRFGAAGVGRSTTGAVVSSSVLILLLDLLLAKLLLVP